MKLEPGMRYIVTKGSDDGTLDVGDHIWLERDLIHCREAQGWSAPEDTAEAMQGVEVMIDDQWYKSHRSKLTKELERLASMEL